MAHTEEPPLMPTGPITYTGRYPGYEPAQAMAAFFSASGQHDRPSYEERCDVCNRFGELFEQCPGLPNVSLRRFSQWKT